jgi:predicted DNA-binding transcriptional regulator AlpA
MSDSGSELPADFRFLRLREVCAKVGLSKTAIYQRMHEGTFPSSYRYRSARAARGVFWLSTDIAQWQASELGKGDD